MSDQRLINSLALRISAINQMLGKQAREPRSLDLARSELFKSLPENL